MIDIRQLRKDLEDFEKADKRRAGVLGVINRFGEEGRNREVGKYQNRYSNEIQIALQYTEGGTNYWSNEDLNKAFNDAVKNNFNMLLEEAKNKVLGEYKEKEKAFNKYVIEEQLGD